MATREAAIKQLQRTFGNLDIDVLSSVLEVVNGDVHAATSFLQADAGGYAFNPQQESNIPSDYPGQSKYVGYGQRKTETDSTSASTSSTPWEQRIKALFVQESTFQDHFDAQNYHYYTYAAVVILLTRFNVEMKQSARTRMLAAAWARHDYVLANYLLEQDENFNLPQVLGALNLLDAGRKVRALQNKIKKLEAQGLAKPKTYGRLRALINDLSREAHIGSVSGSLAQKIRKWVKSIPAEKLTFYALTLPKQPWRELADLVHLHPSKDFQCPFLEIAFDSEPAPGSMLAECSTLDAYNCVEIAKKWKVPYSYLRLHVKPLPEEVKAAVADYAPLDTLLWYHEELACERVDQVIAERLSNGEQPKFGYGKLMERLLYMRRAGVSAYKLLEPAADKRLRSLHLALESPVSVLGDASFSMDVAIRCATIIGSVLTLLTNADLKFFHSECFDPVVGPRTIAQVLQVATETKAAGLTAPACALVNYYKEKKVVKFFIVVTDEIENEKYQGQYFPSLFLKYHKEVYPAKIVFVSFLPNPTEKGRMVTALENMGLVPLQFRLDSNRPDLQKLDSLLGLLATESSTFTSQIEGISTRIREIGLKQALVENSNPATPTTTTTTTSSSEAPTNVEIVQNQLGDLDFTEEEVREEKGKQPEGSANDTKPREEGGKDKLCLVCMEVPPNTVLLECGHLVLCDKCAPQVVEKNSCPLCRTPIARSLRVYHNT
eukprot:Phypoly_transcript_00342.p2 GENE.Phypoly_transcript_00342~~Phypoly_transcript_00342.p2  ORF type:complete len:719 (+),score=127.38 Phypoly_transcript_00342:2610-4766(+)